MGKIKWDDAIKNALYIHTHKDKYAYFYGAKGEVLTDERMEELWNYYRAYFSKYAANQKADIFNYSRGKIGFDCSGFVGYITGDHTYSGAQYAHLLNRSTDLVEGVAGSVLWKPGHIGLDIGYGYFLHFPIEGKSCEIGKISEYSWTHTGLSPNLDYTGADAR